MAQVANLAVAEGALIKSGLIFRCSDYASPGDATPVREVLGRALRSSQGHARHRAQHRSADLQRQ